MAEDLAVLRLGQEYLVAVLCETFEALENYASKANLVLQSLPEQITMDDTSEDGEIGRALQTCGGVWADACFTVLSCRTDFGSGVLRAVGVGNNVKKRKRAGRVAIATGILLFGPSLDMAPELYMVVTQAQHALQQTQQKRSQQWGSRPQSLQPKPSASTMAWLTPDTSTAALQTGPATPAVAAPAAAAAPPPPQPPPAPSYTSFATATPPHIMPTDHGGVSVVDPGVPRECLDDPGVELRSWTGLPGGNLWPFCTLCEQWSDLQHIHGNKHQRRLRNLKWCNEEQYSSNNGQYSGTPGSHGWAAPNTAGFGEPPPPPAAPNTAGFGEPPPPPPPFPSAHPPSRPSLQCDGTHLQHSQPSASRTLPETMRWLGLEEEEKGGSALLEGAAQMPMSPSSIPLPSEAIAFPTSSLGRVDYYGLLEV